MAYFLFSIAFCVFVLSAAKAEEDSTEYGQSPGIKKPNCTCGRTNKEQGRIVGGIETGVNEYPLMAGILERDSGNVFCGGTIITPYHVLTAAHCTENYRVDELAVVVGDHNLTSTTDTKYAKVISIKKIVDHEDYDKTEELEMDISLLLVKEQIYKNGDTYIGPACFPHAKPLNLIKKIVKVLGWGMTLDNGPSSNVLRKVNLEIKHLQVCENYYGGIDVAQSSQLCTYMKHKDACQGDSGGPVLWRDPQTNMYLLVGLVSYGDRCAANKIPGVSTNVQFHRKWILQKIEETKPGTKTCQKV